MQLDLKKFRTYAGDCTSRVIHTSVELFKQTILEQFFHLITTTPMQQLRKSIVRKKVKTPWQADFRHKTKGFTPLFLFPFTSQSV